MLLIKKHVQLIKIMKLIQFNIHLLKVTKMTCLGPYSIKKKFPSPYVLWLPNSVF